MSLFICRNIFYNSPFKKLNGGVYRKIFSDFEKGFKNVIISIEKLHKLIDER